MKLLTYSHSIDKAAMDKTILPIAAQPDNSYRPGLERGQCQL